MLALPLPTLPAHYDLQTQMINLSIGLLFPGETAERKLFLFKSLNQIAQGSQAADSRAQDISFCHQNFTKYLFGHERELQKVSYIDSFYCRLQVRGEIKKVFLKRIEVTIYHHRR